MRAVASYQMEEITNRPLRGIYRWGITILFFSFLLILCLSYFIRYPDIIKAPAVLYAMNPPARIAPQRAGELRLLTTEGATVDSGAILGVIRNPASLDEMQQVKQLLRNYPGAGLAAYIQQLDRYRQLGEVQDDFNLFLTTLKNYYFFVNESIYARQLISLNEQRRQYGAMNGVLRNQLAISKRELQLSEKWMRNDSILAGEKVLSEFDKNRSELSYLPMLKSHENLNKEIMMNDLSRSMVETKINDLTFARQQETAEYKANLEAQLNRLQNSIRNWEQQYLIQAPLPGRVAFSKDIIVNHNVLPSEEIMTVIPNSNDYMAVIMLGKKGAGKVEAGQQVHIKLDNYPYEEYGFLKGTIASISEMPVNEFYQVKIKLSEGLRTSQNITINFHQEMRGAGDIITNDLRLLDRFIYKIRKAIH